MCSFSLLQSLCRSLPFQDRFTPSMLLTKIPRLALIVDLTNTNRYYNSHEVSSSTAWHCGPHRSTVFRAVGDNAMSTVLLQEFANKSVSYEKIWCKGRELPTRDILLK